MKYKQNSDRQKETLLLLIRKFLICVLLILLRVFWVDLCLDLPISAFM